MAGNAYFYGRKAELTSMQLQTIKTFRESGIDNKLAERHARSLMGEDKLCNPQTRKHIDHVFMLFEKAIKGERYNPFWRGHCE